MSQRPDEEMHEVRPPRQELLFLGSLEASMVLMDVLLWFTRLEALQTPSFRVFMEASLVAQRLKHLPAIRETWVRSLSREDPLEKEMATYSSILAWRIPWTEEPGGLHTVHEVAKSWTGLSDFTFRRSLRCMKYKT